MTTRHVTKDPRDPGVDSDSDEESEHVVYEAYIPPRSADEESTPSMRRQPSLYSVDVEPRVRNQQLLPLESYKKRMDSLITEFTEFGSTDVIVRKLGALNCQEYHDIFAVRLIRHALDNSEDDHKACEDIIGILWEEEMITKSQIHRAVEKLTQSVEDLSLDVVDAADRLLRFMEFFRSERMIDSRLFGRLPVAFLTRITEGADEFSEQLTSLRSFKVSAAKFSKDFFPEISLSDVTDFLETVGESRFNHELIRQILKDSLSYNDREREQVSKLLVNLDGLLQPDDILIGFVRLLGTMDDLLLDNPAAIIHCAKFLARATSDEVFPPTFISDAYRLHIGGASGNKSFKKGMDWLSAGHDTHLTSARMAKIWVGTDPERAAGKAFKTQIREIVLAFLDSHNFKEASASINDMDLSPDQATEMIRKIFVFGLDRAEAEVPVCADLVAFLMRQDEVTPENLDEGLRQAERSLTDLQKDDPNAARKFIAFIDKLRANEAAPALLWEGLREATLKRCPEAAGSEL